MRLRIVLLGLMFLLLLPACTYAIDGDAIPVFPEPFGYAGVRVSMGWYNCTQVWFVCRETNSIRYAAAPTSLSQFRLNLAPKLSSALEPRVPGGQIAARPMYLVKNSQNPPIFSTVPGQPDYSALWQAFEVTWRPGVPRRQICNAEPASPDNPCGLPGPAEAGIEATDVVLDCPILALGPLTDPKITGGLNYIIPQAGSVDVQSRLVFMPAWQVCCTDPVTKRVSTELALITDASDPALAAVLGANLAPGLLNVPDEDTTDFYVMRGPKPLTQLPVVRDCPVFPRAVSPVYYYNFNVNYEYSPIMRYVILQRHTPQNCLIKTPHFIDLLLGTGGLTILRDDQRINAPIVISG